MNKKLLFPILTLVLVVIAAYAAYSFAKPKPKVTTKITGTLYWLQKGFTLNMAGGQYATLTVALLLPPTEVVPAASTTDPPPTGIGALPEEAVIRAIITNDITDQPTSALLTQSGRKRLESEILSNIKSQTDTLVTKIFFTDLAVQ
jgi:flagellar FliL protein